MIITNNEARKIISKIINTGYDIKHDHIKLFNIRVLLRQLDVSLTNIRLKNAAEWTSLTTQIDGLLQEVEKLKKDNKNESILIN